jgi:hypothetical protein
MLQPFERLAVLGRADGSKCSTDSEVLDQRQVVVLLGSGGAEPGEVRKEVDGDTERFHRAEMGMYGGKVCPTKSGIKHIAW